MSGDSDILNTEENEGVDGERLLSYVCAYVQIFAVVFAVCLVFTLFSLASIVTLSPTHETYPAAVLAASLNGFMAVLMLALLVACGRHFRR